ncbi:OLC1v1000473C1 [Oldenlandia corymbosa var. corymbosa]|uniref:Hexosyltransferase n=1 Tax=Oldenlandia corymbosa var. corymbosa TaxID=529605 RepID=A0AAV1D5F1_OLDCO|nr:OLC1v1000473C1 [Oldenlandia corymbosa var. corymbosa]
MVLKPFKKNPLPTLFLITIFTIIFLHLWSRNEVSTKIYQNFGKRPKWYQIIAQKFGKRKIRVGLVNINSETSQSIIESMHGAAAEIVKVEFQHVDGNVQWDDLFPGCINEDEPKQQKCPEIPMPPRMEEHREFDVVVADVPCPKGGDENGFGSRDVFRLQVNLVVAQLLVKNEGEIYHVNRLKYAVLMGSCGPMWEIFRCDDLVWNEGILSIYKPDLRKLKQKMVMPVGSCQVAHPFAEPGQEEWQKGPINSSLYHQQRVAYATVLHSSEAYVCGAIALAQSIIKSNSTRDLILLADDHISEKSWRGLEAAGWKIKRIKRIRSPHAKKYAYNEYNYSKLRLWQLTEYDKIVFIDSDLIVLRNLDEFFVYPQLSAVQNNGHIFNSGIMVLEPSECAFQTLMQKRYTMGSYNGGDQGYLNEIFPWWHRWPGRAQMLKMFVINEKDLSRRSGEVLSMKNYYTIHYLGLKPWMCYQDYDCNWDNLESQKHACDWAHEKWWQVYNAMPKDLKAYCELTPKMDAKIKKWRGKARNASLPDGHWKIEIKDPRMHKWAE